MHEFEILQYSKAFSGNYEISVPGFQRCMLKKDVARGYSKPPYKIGGDRMPRKPVLFVILWESIYDYFILDDERLYKWYMHNEILLNDGCKFQVVEFDH